MTVQAFLRLQYRPATSWISGPDRRSGVVTAGGKLDEGEQIAEFACFQRRPRHAPLLHLSGHGGSMVPERLREQHRRVSASEHVDSGSLPWRVVTGRTALDGKKLAAALRISGSVGDAGDVE